MKLSIIVPAYNEARTLPTVLNKLLALDISPWQKEIIVVNDCSTDNTKKVLARFSHQISKIYHHQRNVGKGAAIRTGLAAAVGDYVIVQDADLEYNPNDIIILLATAKNNPGFAIYGSRFRGRHEITVFGHKAGNLLLTAITNLLYGSAISDMETCYKLIPRKYLRHVRLTSNRFDFEPEITAKLLRLNVGILEVPVNYQKRGFSQGKKLKWWRDGFSALWTLVKYRFLP